MRIITSLAILFCMLAFASCKEEKLSPTIEWIYPDGHDRVYVGVPFFLEATYNCDCEPYFSLSFKRVTEEHYNQEPYFEGHRSNYDPQRYLRMDSVADWMLSFHDENDNSFYYYFTVYDTAGAFVFYTQDSSLGAIDVTLDGETLTVNKAINVTPKCGQENVGLAIFRDKKWGTYPFTAKAQNNPNKTWSGTLHINGVCTIFELE